MTPKNVSKVTGIGTIERCSREYPSGREKKFQTAGHVSFRCGAAKPRGIEAASLGNSSCMIPLPHTPGGSQGRDLPHREFSPLSLRRYGVFLKPLICSPQSLSQTRSEPPTQRFRAGNIEQLSGRPVRL